MLKLLKFNIKYSLLHILLIAKFSSNVIYSTIYDEIVFSIEKRFNNEYRNEILENRLEFIEKYHY